MFPGCRSGLPKWGTPHFERQTSAMGAAALLFSSAILREAGVMLLTKGCQQACASVRPSNNRTEHRHGQCDTRKRSGMVRNPGDRYEARQGLLQRGFQDRA